MKNLKEKLEALSSKNPSTWKADAKARKDNRKWIRKSAFIAIRILSELKLRGITQKDLAERMKLSPQQVNKIVQGNENLTLETITKVEEALGITIIEETLPPKSGSSRSKKDTA